MRIDQVIPSVAERDAVSTHTFEAQRVLRGLGVESTIFAKHIAPSLRARVRPLQALGEHDSASRWLLYQASIGSPAAEAFALHRSPKLVNYHNMTSAELIGWFEPRLTGELRLGRSQLRRLAPLTRLGIAVSRYNEAELVEAGYRETVVIPLLINLKVEADVDVAVASRLSEERERGCSRWLFVGQIAPHKAQHALIEALAFYREAYGAASLHLVGRVMSPGYAGGLQRLARALGVEAAVHFEGLVSDSALAAFYSGADAFVCCSDHEGFCAPLIEAMYNQLAVVAFGAGAVPETIGEAGIVLPAKTPSLIAAAVHRVLSDRRLRVRLVEAGAQRALNFDLERTRTSFARAIEAAVRVR